MACASVSGNIDKSAGRSQDNESILKGRSSFNLSAVFQRCRNQWLIRPQNGRLGRPDAGPRHTATPASNPCRPKAGICNGTGSCCTPCLTYNFEAHAEHPSDKAVGKDKLLQHAFVQWMACTKRIYNHFNDNNAWPLRAW